MELTITGGNKSQRNYTRSIVEFCQTKLMPKMTDIEIVVKLRKFPKNAEDCGYCLAVDGPRADRPREFEIEIDSRMKLRRLLETICHEMVHVKQYARGELYESGRQNKHRWQGEWIDKDPDYWDRPWEIEAHGRETGLFVRWAEANELGKKKWTKHL